MSDLYGVIGTSTYTNLLADPEGADVISVPCKPGNGALAVGTLLYRGTDGLYAPAATAQVTAANMLVVLAEAIDTGAAPSSGATAVAEDAKAYRAGVFIDGAVKLAEGASLTAENKAVLRGQNIVFDKKESAETFTNTVKGA